MRGEEPDGDAEADRYGSLLPERLDVTLLSMGEDGHCASLFPGSPQLGERKRLCTTGLAPYAPYERITLTLPALDRSRLVLILALGERKREALARIRAGEQLPSAHGRARTTATSSGSSTTPRWADQDFASWRGVVLCAVFVLFAFFFATLCLLFGDDLARARRSASSRARSCRSRRARTG